MPLPNAKSDLELRPGSHDKPPRQAGEVIHSQYVVSPWSVLRTLDRTSRANQVGQLGSGSGTQVWEDYVRQ